jgi:hypothetical protein
MDDSDLAGPILFFLLFGFCLLFVSILPALDRTLDLHWQSGNLHFGVIYGLVAFGSATLWAVFSLMTPTASTDIAASQHDHPPNNLSSTLTFGRSTSVLGYCILPLIFTSVLGIVLPMDTFFGYVTTSLAIAWCTYSSSAMFCAVGRMSDMRLLVAYPLSLFYVGFGIMAIFSSRGSGALATAAARTL